MGGEGAAREGEDAPAPPRAGAGVLGREGFSSASAFCPSLVSPSCGSLPVPVPLCRIQVPAELICLDPRALAEVDVISLEQAKKERAERLVRSGAPRAQAPLPTASHPHHILRSTAPCRGGCCTFHLPPLPQGYDPDSRAPFQPKPKQKGRGSTASLVKRKRKVMDQEHRVSGHRGWAGHPKGNALLLAPWPHPPATSHLSLPTQDKIRQSLEQQPQKQEKAKPTGARPSALDRFVR